MTDAAPRESAAGDFPALKALYAEAFPDEDLLPLLGRLLRETPEALSLVALLDSKVVGHIVFTECRLEPAGGRVALLGPLAVAPAQQGRGIGRRLIEVGLDRMREASVNCVVVLGDPAFYARFGFSAEKAILPPYELPRDWTEAWRSLALKADASSCTGSFTGSFTGRLLVPDAWREPALWAP